jgi:hypothetical protein
MTPEPDPESSTRFDTSCGTQQLGMDTGGLDPNRVADRDGDIDNTATALDAKEYPGDTASTKGGPLSEPGDQDGETATVKNRETLIDNA